MKKILTILILVGVICFVVGAILLKSGKIDSIIVETKHPIKTFEDTDEFLAKVDEHIKKQQEKIKSYDEIIEEASKNLSPLDKKIFEEWLKENPSGEKEFTKKDYERIKKKILRRCTKTISRGD